jgi:hypothetical protein
MFCFSPGQRVHAPIVLIGSAIGAKTSPQRRATIMKGSDAREAIVIDHDPERGVIHDQTFGKSQVERLGVGVGRGSFKAAVVVLNESVMSGGVHLEEAETVAA